VVYTCLTNGFRGKTACETVLVAGMAVGVFQDRTGQTLDSRSRIIVVVIAFTLFLDYFFYGLLFPLSAHSPGLKDEGRLVLLYGVYAVSVLLVTPLFGYLGDRIGERATMLYGVALAGCAITLFGLASNFPLLLLGRFCQGVASAALWTSGLALIAANYVANRVVMLGYAFAGGTFGSVIGPIAGGFLYQTGGYKMPFLVLGVLFVLAAVLIALYLPADKTEERETVALHSLLLNKSLAVPALTVALAAFSLGIIEPLLPARLARYGATSAEVGIIFTISSLVYGLSSPMVGRVSDRLPFRRVIVLGTIAMAITLPLLAAFHGLILVCIGMSLVNISFAFMLNPASAELGNVVDRSGMSCYSAVYAVYNICYSIGMIGTALLASAAARLLHFWGVLMCASAILFLSSPLLAMTGSQKSLIQEGPNG
jgi:MFS transporter, DHA1 family, solute carrier family 18 (vesicular amine transporter), member 1/2